MVQKNHKLLCLIFIYLFSVNAFGQDFENGVAPFAVITRKSNVRQNPTQKSAVLQILDVDSQIRVIDKTLRNVYLRVLFGDGEQGYVYSKNIAISEDFTKNQDFSLLPETKPPCNLTYRNCPDSGCAEEDAEKALFNAAKRGKNMFGTSPTSIDFDDLAVMQKEIGRRLKLESGNFKINRDVLKKIATKNGVVSESLLVRIIGFIPPTEKGKGLKTGSSESVNCNSTRTVEKDIHIPFVPFRNSTEFQGVIIEMIPQGRSPQWNLKKLQKIQTEKRMIMVVGGLFYDNEHFVNDNPAHHSGNQPIRFSLWEVHPVKEFYVCKKQNTDCNPADLSDWTRLEAYQ